jgi:hypothetical protein
VGALDLRRAIGLRALRRAGWLLVLSACAPDAGRRTGKDPPAAAGAGGVAGEPGAGGASAGNGGRTAAATGGVGASSGANSGGAAGGSKSGGGGTSAGLGGNAATGGSEQAGSASEGGGSGQTTPCDGNCHYVHSDATGANDGSTWTDAFVALPEMLVRGHTYFVAAGTYPGRPFRDAEDGAAVIRIQRATESDHGDAPDWDPDFAAGEAIFGGLGFETGAYEFDGAHATRVVGELPFAAVNLRGDALKFRNVDVDGAFTMVDGMHTAGACWGMRITGGLVEVTGCRIHDAADDGVLFEGGSYVNFAGNEIDSLHGCGEATDCGPCNNGISDGIEIYAQASRLDIVGNYIHDVAGGSAVLVGSSADDFAVVNIVIANNILYTPKTPIIGSISNARAVRLLHNTIWGRHNGSEGGLAIGEAVERLEVFNNVILAVNYDYLGATPDPVEHVGDHNLFGRALGQWPLGPNDVEANDPAFSGIPDGDGAEVADAAPADFTPETNSPARGAGSTDASLELPSDDFFGDSRGSPPTLGAIE